MSLSTHRQFGYLRGMADRWLGLGLNEQAIQAVRQWRFAPATLKGAAVDVIVESARILTKNGEAPLGSTQVVRMAFKAVGL